MFNLLTKLKRRINGLVIRYEAFKKGNTWNPEKGRASILTKEEKAKLKKAARKVKAINRLYKLSRKERENYKEVINEWYDFKK